MAVLMRKNSKNWYVVIYNPATKKHKWISSGSEDKYEAIQMEAELKAIIAGKRKQSRIQAFVESMTEVEIEARGINLDRSWDVYITEFKGDIGLAKTVQKKKHHWSHFLQYLDDRCPGVDMLHEVSVDIVYNYTKQLKIDQKSENFKKYRNNIGNVFRHLMSLPISNCNANPFDLVINPKDDGESGTNRPLTNSEVSNIREYLQKRNKHSGWYEIFEIAAFTGLRQNDCIFLQWKDVDFTNDILKVNPNKTKHQKGGKNIVRIPIHPKLKSILEVMKREGDEEYLFPIYVKWYTDRSTYVTRAWRQIFDSLHIKADENGDMTFKSIRHYFNTALQKLDVSQEIRKKLTGQSSDKINDLYSHDYEGMRKAIMQLD